MSIWYFQLAEQFKSKMVNLKNVYIVISLWNAVCFYGASTKDIFVSMREGKDKDSCGNMASPCQHLAYTLQHVVRNQDIINLDGGIEKPLIYTFNHILDIKIHFTVQKWTRSTFSPTISSTSLQKPLFQFVGKASNNLIEFINLCFKNTSVVDFSAPGSLRLHKCVMNKVVFINRYLPMVTAQIKISDSQIYESKINSKRNIAIKLDVLIVNSTLANSTIRLGYICGELIVKSCKFDYSMLWVRHKCKGYHILIHDTQFHGQRKTNNVMIKDSSVEIIDSTFSRVFLGCLRLQMFFSKNSTFSENRFLAVTLVFVKRVLFQECTFFDNKNTARYGSIFLQNNREVTFRKCVFRDNSARMGGAIFIKDSNSSIIDSHFVGNKAQELGGTIYSTGSLLSLYNVSMNCSGDHHSTNGRHLFIDRYTASLNNVSLIIHNNTDTSPILVYYNQFATMQGISTSNVYLKCPVGHKAFLPTKIRKNTEYLSISCRPCGLGMYNLTSGDLHIQNMSSTPVIQDISCAECEQGGTCDSFIRSSGNYWGYINDKEQVIFTPCPVDYCCSPLRNPCTSYDTCAKNRTGKLCGNCEEGSSLNLLSSTCISIVNCTSLSTIVFIVGHLILSLLYTIFLMYLKEITHWFKKLLSSYTSKLPNIRTRSHENLPDESDEDYLSDDGVTIREYRPSNDPLPHVNDSSSRNLMSGLLKIAFFFYQVEPLLHVHTPLKGKYHYNTWLIQQLISSIFNIKVNADSDSFILCPFQHLDAIGKSTLKVSFVVTMFLVLFSFYWVSFLVNTIKRFLAKKRRESSDDESQYYLYEEPSLYSNVPFPLRIKCCAVKLSLLGYITISTFAFGCVNCVPIGHTLNLYIQGDVECYEAWQWVVIGFIAVYVVPYAGTLYFASSLLSSHRITPNEFLVVLLFPPMILVYLVRSCLWAREPLSMVDKMMLQVYLNDLYGPFRMKNPDNVPVRWECVLLLRKLALVSVATFIIHPVGKLYVMIALLVGFLFNHFRVQPYADETLNVIDSCSMVMLCVLASVNLFWAHMYMSLELNLPRFELIGEVFLFFEMVVLVLPVIVLMAILLYRISKKLINTYKTWICKQD